MKAAFVLLVLAAAVGARSHAQDPRAIGGTAVPSENGQFTVPASRSTGSGRTLTLRFVRFASTAMAPGPPIVFLAGGPGDSGIRAVAGMPPDVLNALLSIADVVAFDQRGTGSSEPRNAVCPPGAILPRDRPADPTGMLEGLRERVRRCLAETSRQGLEISGLTTAESADDLDALRRVLGARRLTLLAGSYGAHLALAAARRHPGLVHRMALAGVEGPDDTLKLPSRVDEVLGRIAAARRPSLLDDVRTLRERLAARPARFVFPTGQAILLGEWDLQRWIAESLGTVHEIDRMIAAIAPMLDGEYAPLGRWALGYRISRPLNLMNLAMDCASNASAGRLERIRAEARTAILGDAINFPLPDLCDLPGLPRLPDSFRAPVVADTPALLISGTFDGRTPVQNAAEVASGMPRARTLVIDGASHGLFREPATMKSVLAFLRE